MGRTDAPGPQLESAGIRTFVEFIPKECGGLPLTLEVNVRYVHRDNSNGSTVVLEQGDSVTIDDKHVLG